MIRALILGGERLMRVMVLVKAKAGIMPSTVRACTRPLNVASA